MQKSEAYDETDNYVKNEPADFKSKYFKPFTSLISDCYNSRNKYLEKLALTGSLEKKLEQLDRRETELLNEIARLNTLIEPRKSSLHRSSSRESFNEKNKLNVLQYLK